MQYFRSNRASNFCMSANSRLLGAILLLLILQPWLPQTASAQLAPGDPNIIEKTSAHEGTDSLCPGDILTYTIRVNAVSETTDRAEVVDELPESVEYVAGSATNGAEFLTEPNRIEWSGPVSMGNPNSFEFQARILADTPNGTVITNIAEGLLGAADAPLSRIYFDYAEDIVNCPTLDQPPSEPMDEPTTCLVPLTNQLSWWPLDEVSPPIASDIRDYPNDGLLIGGPTPATGRVAGGLSFDGVDDKIVIPSDRRMGFSMWSSFTIEAWIRTDNGDGYQPIVDKRDSSSTGATTPYGYNFFLQDGHLGFYLSTRPAYDEEGISIGGIATTPDLADGEWHLVAVTYESYSRRGGKLYVDGQVVHTFTTAPRSGALSHSSDLVIGSHNPFFGLPNDDFFRGTIDEVGVFDGALTQEQIQAVYAAGSLGRCKTAFTDGEVYGTLWHDSDSDGVQQDGEPRLADWTVLLKNDSGSVRHTQTDASGNYRFTNLPDGEYTLTQVFLPSWSQIYPGGGPLNIHIDDEYVAESIDLGNHQNGQDSCHISRHVDVNYHARVGMYINNQSESAHGYNLQPISIPSLMHDNSMEIALFGRTPYLNTSWNPYRFDHYAYSMQNAYAEIGIYNPPKVLGSTGDYQFIATNRDTKESFACSTQLWSNDSIRVEPRGNALNRELRVGETQELGFVVRNLSGETSLTAQLWSEGLFAEGLLMEDGVALEVLRVAQVEPQQVELGPDEWTQVSVTVELSERIMNGVGDVSLFVDINGDGEPDTATSILVESVGPDSDLMLQKGHEGDLVWGQDGLLTVDVSNVGDTVADTFVTVVDILPGGLTALSSYSGEGWACNLSGSVICRYTALPIAAGASLPTLKIPVNINSPNLSRSCTTLHHGADKNLENNQDCNTFEVTVDPSSGVHVVAGNLDESPIPVMLGQIVDVPVMVREIPADVAIGAVSVEIRYDPALLEPVACEANPDGISKTALCNPNAGPGVIRMAMVSPTGLGSEVRLAIMRFRALGTGNSLTPIELIVDHDLADHNGQFLPHVSQNGAVEIISVVKGDVDCSNNFSAVDAMFIMQHEIGMRETTDSCPPPPEMLYEGGGDVNEDGKIDAVDGLLILQCEIGTANTLCPAGTTFENIEGVGDIVGDEDSTTSQEMVTLQVENAENINMGDTFTVNVKAASESSIGAVTASIAYNTDLFEYVGCQTMNGEGISSAGCNQMVNENGEHRVVFSAVIPDGESGSVELAELTFTATGMAVDIDELNLQVHTLAGLDGESLGIATTGNRQDDSHRVYLPMIMR